MEPIGLQFKHFTENPFTGRTSGELMIVHRCLSCSKISINRIAGDDDAYIVLTLIAPMNYSLQNDIRLLTKEDEKEIRSCLFGYAF